MIFYYNQNFYYSIAKMSTSYLPETIFHKYANFFPTLVFEMFIIFLYCCFFFNKTLPLELIMAFVEDSCLVAS